MASVIIMPKLGYTQEEGSLMAWHKQPGETVKKGEAFFDVQTDKSIITVEAHDWAVSNIKGLSQRTGGR